MIALAAATAITLGTPALASADTDSASGHVDPSPSSVRTGSAAAPDDSATSGAKAAGVEAAAAGDATIRAYSFSSGVMGTLQEVAGTPIPFKDQTVYAPGNTSFTYQDGVHLGKRATGAPNTYAAIYVNGTPKHFTVGLWPNRPGEDRPGVDIPRSYGVGKMQLKPYALVYLTPNDNADDYNTWTRLNATGNTIYVRRDTFGTFKARHSGSTVSFGARARLRATDGSAIPAIPARTGYVQYARSGSWKTLKTLSLDSTRNGTWSYKTSSKRTYRFLVKRTSVINGMTIKLPKL